MKAELSCPLLASWVSINSLNRDNSKILQDLSVIQRMVAVSCSIILPSSLPHAATAICPYNRKIFVLFSFF